jgi:hypothetical protein
VSTINDNKTSHAASCASLREFHKPGMIHYETDAGEACPAYHFEHGKCDCLAAEIASLRKQLSESEEKRKQAERLCHDWNSAASEHFCGSEYHDDPKNVFARVRHLRDSHHDAMIKNSKLTAEVANWREDAARHMQNEQFYRGLVVLRW